PGEAPEVTAGRELLEETGYAARSVELLGAMTPDNGRIGNQAWGCIARGVRKVEGRAAESGIEVFEWTVDELYRAVADGGFDHCIHVSLLFLAVLRGSLTYDVTRSSSP